MPGIDFRLIGRRHLLNLSFANLEGPRDTQAGPRVIFKVGLADFLPGEWMIGTEAYEGGNIFYTGVGFLRGKTSALLCVGIEPHCAQTITIQAPQIIDAAATADIN